ncbi:MAG: hypothetical protein PHT69_07795 [Bacteroidales bacterium]|nr:hypothetical protein [Bacteroidales bacterium]
MSNIKLFKNKQVLSVRVEEEQKWYFVVEDVVSNLTDSKDSKLYIKHMRQRDRVLAKGLPEDWIEKRMLSIAIREELTDKKN